jgi:predicted GTPase
MVPEEIPLTSFSILFARYRGDLKALTVSANRLSELRDGDRILISEGCTHHRQCQDIGTVKIPGWIEAFSGKKPEYTFSSGDSFPGDLSAFRLIVHCGGCMINEREMQSRMRSAQEQGVPMVNYGIAIAYMHGILKRSLSPFPEIQKLLR